MVMPGAAPPTDPQALAAIEPQNYLDWVAQQQVFESIAAIDGGGEGTLLMPGAPAEAVVPHRVTAAFFDVLRVRAAIGRVFGANNEVDGRDRVAVLSDAFWRRRFGGDPAIIGRTIPINGQALRYSASCRRASAIPSVRFSRRSSGCPGFRRLANVYVDGCEVSICSPSPD